MRIVKLGKEWGAAHQEAQPVSISQGDIEVEVFVTETYELTIKSYNRFTVTQDQKSGKISITFHH